MELRPFTKEEQQFAEENHDLVYAFLNEKKLSEDEYYDEVRAIVKVLNFVHEAEVDFEIPPTSLVREFIGGNSFYRK